MFAEFSEFSEKQGNVSVGYVPSTCPSYVPQPPNVTAWVKKPRPCTMRSPVMTTRCHCQETEDRDGGGFGRGLGPGESHVSCRAGGLYSMS